MAWIAFCFYTLAIVDALNCPPGTAPYIQEEVCSLCPVGTYSEFGNECNSCTGDNIRIRYENSDSASILISLIDKIT